MGKKRKAYKSTNIKRTYKITFTDRTDESNIRYSSTYISVSVSRRQRGAWYTPPDWKFKLEARKLFKRQYPHYIIEEVEHFVRKVES